MGRETSLSPVISRKREVLLIDNHHCELLPTTPPSFKPQPAYWKARPCFLHLRAAVRFHYQLRAAQRRLGVKALAISHGRFGIVTVGVT